MSTVFSPSKSRVTQAGDVAAQRQEPKLRIVYGAPFRPPRMPFVIFVVSLLAAGLVGLLLLNTELQRGTFQVTELNHQADQLRDQQEQLERQVRTLESPQNLADRALGMGMVPNPNPVFLRLSDGQVLGVPAEGKAGTGTAMFGPNTPTGTKPSTPVTPKPPAATKPPTGSATKPPAGTATKPPTGTATKPPVGATTKPPTGTATKPPTNQTSKPPSTSGRPTVPGTTGARTNSPTGG